MKTEIIDKMAAIVEATMTAYKTDFYEFDLGILKGVSCQLPAIWIVSKMHTRLLQIGNYRDWFFSDISVRQGYSIGDDGFSYMLEKRHLWDGDRIFLVTEDDLREITVEQAKSAIKDYVNPAVEEWKKLHGPLKKMQVKVKLKGITISQLKALLKDCEEHEDDSLRNILNRFHNYRLVSEDHCVEVTYKQPEYVSFQNSGESPYFWFEEHYNGKTGLVGSITFHGWPETGYMQNGSVQIDPQYGWSSHT